MSPAVFDMYAGCSTLDEGWAVPEHDGQICTLLAAPQGDFHPPHHRAPLTLPVTEKQWTQLQVRIRGILLCSADYNPFIGSSQSSIRARWEELDPLQVPKLVEYHQNPAL